MRLGEAIPKYQAYRNQLQEQKKNIYQNMKDAQEKAREILTENTDALHRLSKYLLEKETITGEEFMEILNK